MSSLQSDTDFWGVFQFYGSQCQPFRREMDSLPAGFSGASVWAFSAPAGELILKQWPLPTSDAGMKLPRWEAIAEFLRCVASAGEIPVAAPLPTGSQQAGVWFQGRLWHLEPHLPGQPVASRPTPAQLQSAAQTLAAFHRQAAKFTPTSQKQQHFLAPRVEKSPSLGRRLEILQEWEAHGAWEELLARAIQAGRPEWMGFLAQLQRQFQVWSQPLLQELQFAVQQLLPLQPVWRDMWREHLLFTSEQVTGLIDPGACTCDSVLTDFTRLAGSLLGNDTSAWQTFLATYEHIRPLSPVERNSLLVFDLSNLLLSARLCFERLVSSLNASATLHQRLATRLQEYLIRLETYQKFRTAWLPKQT